MDDNKQEINEEYFERFDPWYEFYYPWGEVPEKPLRDYSDNSKGEK